MKDLKTAATEWYVSKNYNVGGGMSEREMELSAQCFARCKEAFIAGAQSAEIKNIYLAQYNPMTEESAYETLSVHLSKEGAEKALEEHISEQKEKHDRRTKVYPDSFSHIKFGKWEDWRVEEIEVLP